MVSADTWNKIVAFYVQTLPIATTSQISGKRGRGLGCGGWVQETPGPGGGVPSGGGVPGDDVVTIRNA